MSNVERKDSGYLVGKVERVPTPESVEEANRIKVLETEVAALKLNDKVAFHRTLSVAFSLVVSMLVFWGIGVYKYSQLVYLSNRQTEVLEQAAEFVGLQRELNELVSSRLDSVGETADAAIENNQRSLESLQSLLSLIERQQTRLEQVSSELDQIRISSPDRVDGGGGE